jgi:hypothetical protein
VHDEIADDDLAGSNPDPYRRMTAWKKLEARCLCDNIQRGPCRTLRVIVVSGRVAEVGEQAVAHEFGQEAIVTGHDVGADIVKRADQFPVVFNIEFGRQRRRAHQIAEHDRQLSAFSLIPGRRTWFRGVRSDARILPGQFGDSRHQDASMTQQHAKILQILLGQVAQSSAVHAVLDERLGVLPKI